MIKGWGGEGHTSGHCLISPYHLIKFGGKSKTYSWTEPLLNWFGTPTLSLLVKLPTGKLELWFVLRSFILPNLLWYSIRPCMEYCCHVWAGAPSCYLELLDKLQKWICRTASLLLAASLEPQAYHWNVGSVIPLYRYYFGTCSSELTKLVPLPYSWGRSTHYSDRLHDFSVAIPRCYKYVYFNGFFSCTARLWNSLPMKFFPLTYDLSGFKSRIKRHLLTVGSF